MRILRSFALLFALATPAAAQSTSGTALIDTAIARMGGADLLRSLTRVRFELMTQWARTAFDARPFADQPSYEWHTDQRDYSLAAWRNTRRFNNGASWVEITDIVRDTVAIRRSPGGAGGVASPASVPPGTWTTLNIAYVDDRDERFAFAPERLLLAARSAGDLRAGADTSMAGAPHARFTVTVGKFATTIFVRRSTGMLTAARFRVAEPNDFGLVPWGEMEVELWYSAWRKQPSGLVYPYQWDERRVAKTYKRITVLGAQFNPVAMPDSFAVSDSLRGAYLATARKPMHDLPVDSARIVDGRFASFNTPGTPAGAVKIGGVWVLLEGGQAPLSVERASTWLAHTEGGGPLVAALVTMPSTGSGGAAWLSSHGVALHVAPGAAPFVDAVMRGNGATSRTVQVETKGRWMRVGSDSLWVEPIDLADAPGALIAYAPSLNWVYSGMAASAIHLDRVLAVAKARGWRVTHVGSARAVATAIKPAV